MKQYFFVFSIILSVGLFACKKTEEIKVENKQKFNCTALSDKNALVKFGDSIITSQGLESEFRLTDFDTTNLFVKEDYFTNSTTKSKLVVFYGSVAFGHGSLSNFCMLFTCDEFLKLEWSGSVGVISENEIRDLNGDGIKEIEFHSGHTGQGITESIYEISNFKNGKKNDIYYAHSSSELGVSIEQLATYSKKGDTIDESFSISIIKMNDNKFMVKQVDTFNIFNGGNNEDEMLKNLLISTKTTETVLK
jgi:hypothetical protein